MSTDLSHRGKDSGVDLARHGATAVSARARPGCRVAVVAARFNAPVVDRLVDGALSYLAGHGVAGRDILLVRVPGAWELPLAASRAIDRLKVDAVVALGCVIRGETSHYDVIVNESARGLMQLALESGVPVANGVLACENQAQAFARAGGDAGNKGEEAAAAALEMAGLMREPVA